MPSLIFPRKNITDSGSSFNSLLALDSVAFDLALPWWTGLPGTIIDLLVAAVTVSGGWVRPSKSDIGTTKGSLLWNWFTTVLLFTQSISGLIHILRSFQSTERYSLGLVQRLGGNSFAALFANSIKLWDKALLDNPKTLLLAGWVNIILSLAVFIILSLPIVGSAPMFQASSPFCTWVLNDGTGFQTSNTASPAPNAVCQSYNWLNDSTLSQGNSLSSHSQIRCADADSLRLGYTGAYNTLTTIGDYAHMMQSPWLGWAFASVVVVLLVLTAIMQLRRNSDRKGLVEEKTEKWTGKVMMALFFLSLAISISVLISQQEGQAAGFSASVVVCPEVLNGTTYATLSNETCTCVDILRQYEGSVASVIRREERVLGRFIYNFI